MQGPGLHPLYCKPGTNRTGTNQTTTQSNHQSHTVSGSTLQQSFNEALQTEARDTGDEKGKGVAMSAETGVS